jgi:hypothetical protein
MVCFECDDDKSQGPRSVADDDGDGGDNDNHSEEEDTVDPQEERQELWAEAEGYTPLSDLNNHNYTSLMVSMGPCESDDDSEDEKDNDNDNDHPPSSGGTFFIHPSAFSAGDQDETELDAEDELDANDKPRTAAAATPEVLDQVDFQSIADTALSALDHEYERTLRVERRPPSEGAPNPAATIEEHKNSSSTSEKATVLPAQTEQEDEDDWKQVIAAAFDRGKEALLEQRDGTSFAADWDALPSSSSTEVAAPTPTPTPTNKDPPPVDTDAVRKAVQALSEQTEAPFNKKFAEWQQRQPSLPSTTPHDLIPPTPYKAFRRSTDKAKQATASLSRSATLAEALVRLRDQQLLPTTTTSTTTSTAKSTFVLHVVGVDHVECESVERIQATFRPIIRWMGAWKDCVYQDVQVRLIGRDLSGTTSAPVNLLTPHTATKLTAATATCHSGVYHEWLEQLVSSSTTTSDDDESPDLIIAFNAGIWGYQEWQPTLQYLSDRTTAAPFVITAYTLLECEEDLEVIQTATIGSTILGGERSSNARNLWGPERNPFGSKVIRETKARSNEYRENAAWQAWSLGGGAPA